MPNDNTTYQVQKALAALGFPPGPLDGIPGTKTTQALRNYQMSRRLVPDGIVGAKTLSAFQRDGFRFPSDIGVSSGFVVSKVNAGSPLTPWLEYARSNLGVAEVVGPKHSPTIMGWLQELGARRLGLAVKDDETAWCGSFVGICILRSLPNEPLPPILVRAKAWEGFGVALKRRSQGAVMVFDREGGGHVGFYEGEDDTHFHIIGGNQGNKVSRMRLERSRLTATRWPATVPLPTAGPVIMTPSGDISRNER